jgi:hypothetical protein
MAFIRLRFLAFRAINSPSASDAILSNAQHPYPRKSLEAYCLICITIAFIALVTNFSYFFCVLFFPFHSSSLTPDSPIIEGEIDIDLYTEECTLNIYIRIS